MAVPIWKDYIAEVNGVYRIVVSATGDVIYTGYSVPKPGDSYGKVRINDICADYIVNTLPTLTDRSFTALSAPTFKLQMRVSAAGGYQWVDLYTIQFYNNWSYDYGQTSKVLSAPINGHVDLRMPILFTALDLTQLQAVYRVPGGSYNRIITLPTTPASGTGTFKANAVSTFTKSITINNTLRYDVVGACYKFALYYVNAYGGWDQFLLEGNDLESDELTRYIREVEYDNNLLINRGKDNYVNEVTKTWSLHSGVLTGDQGSRMHHLLNSPLVYLMDIPTGDMIPVIIKDNTCEYKTIKNQGGRMVEYTILVELAQNRIRR